MTPLGIIRRAQADTPIDEDGDVVALELLPGFSLAELRDFARRVPCRVPPEITELLGACSGLEGTIDQVDFAGRIPTFEFEAAFPYGLPLAADGFGNFYVVDLHPHSTRWGPIYFVCHDAPVILYQSDSLEKFLTELFRMFEPPHESLIDDVHEDRPARVWKTNPGVLSYERCLRSEDPILSAFARARRHVSNSRPTQREARRWLFLGTLRPEYPEQAFPYARRLRLPEAEEHHLPAPRTRGLIGLFPILLG